MVSKGTDTHGRVHLTEELPAKAPCSSSESSVTQDLCNVNLRLELKWMKRPPSLRQTSLANSSRASTQRNTHSFYLLHTLEQGREEQTETSLSRLCLSRNWRGVRFWSGSAWGFRFTDIACNIVLFYCWIGARWMENHSRSGVSP